MNKHFFFNFLFLTSIVAFLGSCANEKKILYFQLGVNESDTLTVAKTYISKIQSGDILSIYVSSLSPEASSFFNPYVGGDVAGSSQSPLSQSNAPGYLVNQKGMIEIPLVGGIKISDLTTSEASDTIKTFLKKYLKEPTVNVRVLNYRISMLGEVSKPSVYVIPNEQVSLPEALSLAGDLTITGRRDRIMIIRDQNGKKQFGYVDLTSRDLYKSPYYYLHANDVVYVEPASAKVSQASFLYRVVPFLIGILTAVVLVITQLK